MRDLYVVDTGRGIRAETWDKESAYQQWREYLTNFWGSIDIYHYIIENPDIRFQCEDWEIDFYIDDNYLHMDEWEDYWLWRCKIETLREDFIS